MKKIFDNVLWNVVTVLTGSGFANKVRMENKNALQGYSCLYRLDSVRFKRFVEPIAVGCLVCFINRGVRVKENHYHVNF